MVEEMVVMALIKKYFYDVYGCDNANQHRGASSFLAISKQDDHMFSITPKTLETFGLLTLAAPFIDDALCSIVTITARIRAGLTVIKALLTIVDQHFLACDKGFMIRMIEAPKHGSLALFQFKVTPLHSS